MRRGPIALAAALLVAAGPAAAQGISPGHIVVFREGWCSLTTSPNCFDDASQADWATVALTTVLYNTATGEIADADIELNGWDGGAGSLAGAPSHGWYFTCGDPGGPCMNYGQPGCIYMDLLNTVAHEAGHFIGISHTCNAGGEDWIPVACNGFDGTTMFPRTTPGFTEQRDLSADDEDAVCTIYCTEPDGTCARSSTLWFGSTTQSGKQLYWPSRTVTYRVNPPKSTAVSPTCAGGTAIATVTAGFDEWHRPCTNLQLVNGGPTTEIRVGLVADRPPSDDDDGCGCSSTGPAALVPFALAALALRRRPLRRR